MADEINRDRWEKQRAQVLAMEWALERTIPRFLGAALGGKDSGPAPELPTYEQIAFGKMGTRKKRRTIYDTAHEANSFVEHKWWVEDKGKFDYQDGRIINIAGDAGAIDRAKLLHATTDEDAPDIEGTEAMSET